MKYLVHRNLLASQLLIHIYQLDITIVPTVYHKYFSIEYDSVQSKSE